MLTPGMERGRVVDDESGQYLSPFARARPLSICVLGRIPLGWWARSLEGTGGELMPKACGAGDFVERVQHLAEKTVTEAALMMWGPPEFASPIEECFYYALVVVAGDAGLHMIDGCASAAGGTQAEWNGKHPELPRWNWDYPLGRQRLVGDSILIVTSQCKVIAYSLDFVVGFAHRSGIRPPGYTDSTPCAWVAVECDGHDFHEKTKQQAAHDKKRDRVVAGEGLTTLRFTGHEIAKDAIGRAGETVSYLVNQWSRQFKAGGCEL